jgi:HSP20 family molecular chaperone IbpA
MPSKENPYDEFLKQLAKMVEDMLRTMPNEETTRIIGCTIITGNTDDPGIHVHGSNPQKEELTCELIETGDRIYITARLPADIRSAAYADISPETVYIVVNEERTRIDLPAPIDIIHSYYQVRHGVIDIILKKKQMPARETPRESPH